MWYDVNVLNKIIKSFCDLGNYLNIKVCPEITHDSYISDIYLSDDPRTIQIEIDWREKNVFMYVVNIVGNTLPENVIYKYSDGTWCRKYIEEIYHVKNVVYANKKIKCTDEFLYCLMDFYISLIKNNPNIIRSYL